MTIAFEMVTGMWLFDQLGFCELAVLATMLIATHQMAIVVVCTTLLSALLHGLTANSLASLLAARAARQERLG